MRRALALHLTARGYRVSVAEDGTTALNAAASGAPDVIVLDLGLPDLDGIDIIRAVRGYSRTPIVVLSGRAGSGDTAIDLAGRTVARSGPDGQPERVTLTPTEWQLLEVLLTHPGRLISQRQLLSELRGQPGYTDSSYLRLYIAQLRHKLEDEPSRPRHLLTEPGMGYRYQP